MVTHTHTHTVHTHAHTQVECNGGDFLAEEGRNGRQPNFTKKKTATERIKRREHVEKLITHRTIGNYGCGENSFLAVKQNENESFGGSERIKETVSRWNHYYITFYGSFPLLVAAKYGLSPRVRLLFPAFSFCRAACIGSILSFEYGHSSNFLPFSN